MYQVRVNSPCRVTHASVSPQAGTQHPPALSGQKGKVLWEWTQMHPELKWHQLQMQDQIFPIFTFMHPTRPVLFHHWPGIWDRSKKRDRKWEIFQGLAVARCSTAPDVGGCHVPGNQTMVQWGLGCDRRSVQVQIASHTAHFRKSEGRAAIQQA